ncbi:uncharacterized protein LOC136752263 isoform X2 [Amia ocellicauda]|uniref:uncharacterized protein LOC136752263 isoform X2 n=1 Tax=Amia ocellicauda TaxID=2972642 RepID=UPI0034649E9D
MDCFHWRQVTPVILMGSKQVESSWPGLQGRVLREQETQFQGHRRYSAHSGAGKRPRSRGHLAGSPREPQEEQACSTARYFSQNGTFAWRFVESFVANVLRDELLPDLLIEVFSEDSAQESVVKLTDKDTVKTDRRFGVVPGRVYVELLHEVTGEVVSAVFQSSIREHVDAYLAQAAVRHCVDKIISETLAPLLPTLVQEVQVELAEDGVVEFDLLPEVLGEEARAVALSVLAEHDCHIAAQQLTHVCQSAGRLVDVLLMGQLVELMAGQGQRFREQEQAGWVLNILLHRLCSAQRLRDATLENWPMRVHHRRLFTDVVLDVLLSELTEAVGEDLEDLLEYEQLVEGAALH